MNLILPKTFDLRFDFLAEKAKDEGFTVLRYEHTVPAEQGLVFLPMGLGETACLDALTLLPEESTVFAGNAASSVKHLAQTKRIRLIPLLENEYYLLQNSIHTAEGVLAELLARTKRRLDQLCILIYGYGNCGSAIAKLLWLCGCEIWVWSRSRGQQRASRDGFNLYPAPQKGLGMFDGVINTVPDPVFPLDFLSTMQGGSFFFQVASGTSGIDPKALEALDVQSVLLHGLPGKYCPASEADAIWSVVETTLDTPRRSTL